MSVLKNIYLEKEFLRMNTQDSNDVFITETDELPVEKNQILIKLVNSIPDGEKIEKLAKELKEDITSLEEKIEKFLAQHQSDYIVTFNEFIDTVKKDLKLKIEQMENNEQERRKINDINLILCERDYFRQESIRLNDLNIELSKKNEDFQQKMKFQINENCLITKKWMETEKLVKQITAELEYNLRMKINRDEDNLNHLKNLQISLPKLANINFDKNEEDHLNTNMKINFNFSIEKFKMELKKEKSKNQKLLTEFNKLINDKNLLEKLFIDCVEECRKEIYQRKLKESLIKKNNMNVQNFKYYKSVDELMKGGRGNQNNFDIDADLKIENLFPSDKRRIFEIFIMKDEIINLVKNHIFSKIEKVQEASENPNIINVNINKGKTFTRGFSNSQKPKANYRAKTAFLI